MVFQLSHGRSFFFFHRCCPPNNFFYLCPLRCPLFFPVAPLVVPGSGFPRLYGCPHPWQVGWGFWVFLWLVAPIFFFCPITFLYFLDHHSPTPPLSGLAPVFSFFFLWAGKGFLFFFGGPFPLGLGHSPSLGFFRPFTPFLWVRSQFSDRRAGFPLYRFFFCPPKLLYPLAFLLKFPPFFQPHRVRPQLGPRVLLFLGSVSDNPTFFFWCRAPVVPPVRRVPLLPVKGVGCFFFFFF